MEKNISKISLNDKHLILVILALTAIKFGGLLILGGNDTIHSHVRLVHMSLVQIFNGQGGIRAHIH
jgi:hypothetical protein